MGPGETMRISMCSCLQWFRKCCATHVPVCPAVHQGTEGNKLDPCIVLLVPYWLILGLAAGFRHQATEQYWTVIPGMYGVHCKHSSSIQPLISNNNLVLLGYGSMCSGTLDHIARYQSKTSNNNKTLTVGLLHYDCISSCFLYLSIHIPCTVLTSLFMSLSHLAIVCLLYMSWFLGFAHSDSEAWNEVEPSTEDQAYLSEQAD